MSLVLVSRSRETETDDCRRDAGGPLWTLLMLELWHREFADAPAAESYRHADMEYRVSVS